ADAKFQPLIELVGRLSSYPCSQLGFRAYHRGIHCNSREAKFQDHVLGLAEFSSASAGGFGWCTRSRRRTMAYSIFDAVYEGSAIDLVWAMGTQCVAKFCHNGGFDRHRFYPCARAQFFTAGNVLFQSRCQFRSRIANAISFEDFNLIVRAEGSLLIPRAFWYAVDQ